jgi:tRNA(Ile)-lysidine synthase
VLSTTALLDPRSIFRDFTLASRPALVAAVSGGSDSLSLLFLLRDFLAAHAPATRLVAVTVDHGLRAASAKEAATVAALCETNGIAHRIMRWTGDKPKSGLPAAAREARYRLLFKAARASGAAHIATAHTRDDQAETLLMRLLRGSGVSGLSAMAAETEREGVRLSRPLLEISKAELIATLEAAGIAFADDPTNRDPAFTRPRLRALMPLLAEEGADARTLARLALRFARANAAVEVLADGAERYLASTDRSAALGGYDAHAFAALPEEIRLRLLKRAIDRCGHEGPAELGKVETLLAAVDRAIAERQTRLKQTLAGAVISLSKGRILIRPAPPRRRRPA